MRRRRVMEGRMAAVEATLDRVAEIQHEMNRQLVELAAAGEATERRLRRLADNVIRHTHEDEA